MPERWLQIKGDPSVREFLFQQHYIDHHTFLAKLDHFETTE